MQTAFSLSAGYGYVRSERDTAVYNNFRVGTPRTRMRGFFARRGRVGGCALAVGRGGEDMLTVREALMNTILISDSSSSSCSSLGSPRICSLPMYVSRAVSPPAQGPRGPCPAMALVGPTSAQSHASPHPYTLANHVKHICIHGLVCPLFTLRFQPKR